MNLLRTLQPPWWFAAHMHVRFTASVPHEVKDSDPVANPDEIKVELEKAPTNPDEITMSDEEEDVAPPPPPPPPMRETKFVALDKCLPKRKFLDVRPDFPDLT